VEASNAVAEPFVRNHPKEHRLPEWRELADQLTADQIADLRDQERNPRNRGA
jgi:hypothetical protein